MVNGDPDITVEFIGRCRWVQILPAVSSRCVKVAQCTLVMQVNAITKVSFYEDKARKPRPNH